jgi:hypothetical protein
MRRHPDPRLVKATPILQHLSSGLQVRQDFRTSVRFVMFRTGVEGWEYSTHGGTAFIVNFRGKPFGLTCRHVLRDFYWGQLAITAAKFGRKGSQFAALKSLAYPSDPRGEAVDTDILDLAVVEFGDDVGPAFFTDPAYILDANTVGTSEEGDVLLVSGTLKEKSELSGTSVTPTFCLLEFVDCGAPSTDPSLRQAHAGFADPEFSTITGLSGSPVFNASTNRLAGMVVRGAFNRRACTICYVDIFDIMQFLTAVAEGHPRTDYVKTLHRLVVDRTVSR